jgi:putative membrane protein
LATPIFWAPLAQLLLMASENLNFSTQTNYSMKKQLRYLCFSLLSIAAISCTDHEVDDMLSEMDRSFMISAADANLFEIQAGEMAKSKAAMDSVREYGEHMVMDHSMATAELKTLAAKKGVDLPEMLSPEKMMKIDSLSALSGMEFDKKYTMMMVVSHKETIMLFDKEFTSGQDHEVRSFAGSKLANLHHHLQKAEALKEMVW